MNEDFIPFDREWMEPILEAIGGIEGHVEAIELVFETSSFATLTTFDRTGAKTGHVLEAWGVAKIAQALNLPFPAQQVTIRMQEKCFVIIECRLVPKNAKRDAVLDALRYVKEPA